MQTSRRLRVNSMRYEAQHILSIELVSPDAHPLAPFTPGAHITLHLSDGLSRAYSLINDPAETHRYVIGVHAASASRGGSRFVHQVLRCGDLVEVDAPRNLFPVLPGAFKRVFIAGGIGITPILCMYRDALRAEQDCSLLYCARSASEAAFLDEIRSMQGDINVRFDADHDGRPVDLAAWLSTVPKDTHLYCCGPAPMLRSFDDACRSLALAHAYTEQFSAAPAPAATTSKTGFVVRLERQGREVEVSAEQSILDALLAEGIDVNCSCREGICGACETRVLAGEPDHRDQILSDEEKQAGQVMMICVSRCKGPRLSLDL
jgi:tetrachlorobenzoquinone reductase